MNLKLYHRWACSYSASVRSFIKDHELEHNLELIEIDEVDGAIETLLRLNGRPQVPCLVIGEKPMLESRDIINWLDQNLLGSPQTISV